jgi:hypothetical protein
VKTKAPVRHHGRRAYDLAVLLSYLDWGRPSKEIEVENATKSVVLEILSSTGGVVNLEVDNIAVEEEYTMRFLGRNAMLEVYRMVPIEICACRNLVGITGPQCTNII